MGGFNEGKSGGSKDHRTSKRTSKIADSFKGAAKNVGKFVASGGFTGAVIRGLTKASNRKNKKDSSGKVYSGEALGYNEAAEKKDFKPNSFTGSTNKKDPNPQGIELAKASTTSATILGPAEIQKEAANTVKGPTTTEMSADQISLANKRKGRRATNITAKTTLAKNYKLSEKTLLG